MIWPRGSELADVVLLANGDTLRPGDEVTGTGAHTPVEPLSADRNSYWAHVIGFCAPDADTVVALDTARRAADAAPEP